MKAHHLLPAVLFLAITAGSPALAADGDRDLRKELRSREEARRIEALAALADSGRRDAVGLIAGRLGDPSQRVRAAAAEALGRIGGGKAVARLLAAMKPLKDDTRTLLSICRALGTTGSPAAVDALAGLAKKEMSRSVELTKAAAEALGGIRDRRSVEELIGLLGTATPTSSSRTYSYGHPELVAPIRAALRRLTGQRLGSHPGWAAWWRRVKKTFRFPDDDASALEGTVYRDEGFRFRIERPSRKRWEFSRPRGAALEVRFRGARDEATYGAVQVLAHRASEVTPSTPEGLAELYADRFADEFKDVKELEERRGRLGGRPAIRQRLVGMTRHGLVVVLTQWIVLDRGNLFTVRATLSSGAAEKVRRELEGIVGSFRFL